MKLRILSLISVLMLSFTTLTACGSANSKKILGSQANTSNTTSNLQVDSQTAFEEKFAGVEKLDDGPLLYIKDTEASAGEYAEVTLAVKNANLKWNMCGIHITFPNVLDCKTIKEGVKDVSCTAGDALFAEIDHVSMEWQQNLTDELINKELGSVFFTALFDGNNGLDGDIATFYFKIPEDAQQGTTYEIGFYYMNTDIFSNAENDPAFERYAFENWESGTITVK